MESNKKNKVVRAWVNQHLTDHYVHMAKHHGYRSRAAYKLLELDEEYNIFNNISLVVDLGCAPGSWSQVAREKLGKDKTVIGVDLLPMQEIPGVTFIQGDFTEEETLNRLIAALGNRQTDLVISDMAPNLSGIKGVDQARMMYLVELVLDFAKNHLKTGGNCIIKVFNGGEFSQMLQLARQIFTQVVVSKPDASRSKSSETYLVCRNLK
jgi:23S rRNA (uridine2552-2'-O)-methyltransferase